MAGPLLQPLLLLLLSFALGSAEEEGLHPAQDTGERIINGNQCPRGAQPWQVALYHNNVFLCAGVLVHEKWVLTVADCYSREYIVQIGTNLLVDRNAQKIRATEFFTHPRYDVTTNVHNIMLLKLSSPAKLSPTVRIMKVPSSCKQPGTTCTVSGWGSTTMDGAVRNPAALMCSNVRIIPYNDCKQVYPILLRKFTICAAPPSRSSFTCKGDSGSRLICQGSLQGLVSSDYFPCHPPFDPIIYTRVCKYRKWIYETIIKNC
ncbi:kallikrein-7-like [Myotis daubentonii]|uniref:kallikrein-7-like n=1 Tax=Myotis daubentonii TaxID=98922 RepID=UPI002872ED7E|nr:kallikrein-7-like [Myotis daubentonii]